MKRPALEQMLDDLMPVPPEPERDRRLLRAMFAAVPKRFNRAVLSELFTDSIELRRAREMARQDRRLSVVDAGESIIRIQL